MRAGVFPFPRCWSVYNEQSTTWNTLSALLVNEQPNRVGKIYHDCLMASLDALWEMTVGIGRSQERLIKLNPENIYWTNSKNAKTVINQTGVGGLKLTSLKQSLFKDDANWWYIYKKKSHELLQNFTSLGNMGMVWFIYCKNLSDLKVKSSNF